VPVSVRAICTTSQGPEVSFSLSLALSCSRPCLLFSFGLLSGGGSGFFSFFFPSGGFASFPLGAWVEGVGVDPGDGGVGLEGRVATESDDSGDDSLE
jgi:hypothetical protein